MNLLTHWRKDPKKKAHIKGMARVAVYFSVLGVASAILTVRSAKAQVAQEGLELGRQLAQRMDALAGEGKHETTKLRLNGQVMYVSNALVKDPAKDVLDRFAEHCEKNLAQSPKEWNGLADAPGELGDAKVTGEAGVVRAGSDKDGMVMCLTKTKASKPKLSEAVQAFAETGELSALGELRYVFVQTTPKGKTQVLTAWTHETFSVKEMMPPEGVDSPGADIAGLPRPPASWRMISATAEGTGYAMNVYRSDDSPEKISAFYEAEMKKLDFTGGAIPFARPNGEVDGQIVRPEEGTGKTGLAFAKEGAVFTVGIKQENGKSYVAAGYAGTTARATAE
jgi:hypothetical protein